MGLAPLAAAFSWEGNVRHWSLTPAAIAGGLVFGIGAALNGGCVFSTASRAMKGDLGLVLTVLGWPIGILLAGPPPITPVGTGDLEIPSPLALCLGLFLAVELVRIAIRIARSGGLGRSAAVPVYTLSAAAAVIGLAKAVILILTGPWSVTGTLLCLVAAAGSGCGRPGVAIAISAAALLGMAVSSLQRGSFRIRVPVHRARPAARSGGGDDGDRHGHDSRRQ
jgi:uncharacterized protein